MTGPVTALVEALAKSDTPVGGQLRSMLSFPFGIGNMVRAELAELEERPTTELAADLRRVQAVAGTLAGKLEAGLEVGVDELLEILEQTAPEPELVDHA